MDILANSFGDFGFGNFTYTTGVVYVKFLMQQVWIGFRFEKYTLA
jgi:hypothetical protein